MVQAQLIKNRKNSLYICAGGFEDRVRGVIHIFKELNDKVFKYSFILEYNTHKDDNKENLDFLEASLNKYSSYHLENVIIDVDNLLLSRNNLKHRLEEIPKEKFDTVFIDISGMTNFLILLTMKMVNNIFYDKKIFILYTEAKNYYPKENEKDEIYHSQKKKMTKVY